MTAEVVVHFHADGDGLCRNAVRLANRGVRFEEAQAVLELDVKSVFPTQAAGVADAGKGGFAVRLLELNPCFQKVLRFLNRRWV